MDEMNQPEVDTAEMDDVAEADDAWPAFDDTNIETTDSLAGGNAESDDLGDRYDANDVPEAPDTWPNASDSARSNPESDEGAKPLVDDQSAPTTIPSDTRAPAVDDEPDVPSSQSATGNVEVRRPPETDPTADYRDSTRINGEERPKTGNPWDLKDYQPTGPERG